MDRMVALVRSVATSQTRCDVEPAGFTFGDVNAAIGAGFVDVTQHGIRGYLFATPKGRELLASVCTLGMSPAEANRNRHRNQYVHARNPEDNETAICESTEGAASLDPAEVNCPTCRSILGLAVRS